MKTSRKIENWSHLYGDGTTVTYVHAESEYLCDFQFQLFPNDTQYCNFTVQVINYPASLVKVRNYDRYYNPK